MEESPTSEQTTTSKVELPSIPLLLEDYQCHFTWVAKTNESNPFTKEQAEIIQRGIANKWVWDDKQATLCYNGMKTIADKCTQAFCNIVLNNIEAGKVQIKEADALTRQCILENHFPEEYAGGFYYITKGLHLLQLCHRIEIGSEGLEKLDKRMRQIVPFDKLRPKGQVAVRVVEYAFYHNRKDISPQAELLLKKIIEKDNNYYQWHYERYKLLHKIRCSCHPVGYLGEKDGPSVEEICEIIKAEELASNNPFIKVAVCQCLLEIFRERYTRGQIRIKLSQNPIKLGSLTFDCPTKVVDFIRKKCSEAEELPASGSVYRKIGAFFSSVLPPEFRKRNYAYAQQCISKGLENSPNSSKMNHRMGLILLNDKKKNSSEALEYFKIAVENDPRNFPALSSLIKTYLSACNLYAEKLENIFQTNLNTPGEIWSKDKLGNLYYFCGLFKYMQKDKNAAIDHWIKGYSIDPASIEPFHSLNYHSSRHRWNLEDKFKAKLIKVLKNAPGRHEEEKVILRKIILNLPHQYYPRGPRKPMLPVPSMGGSKEGPDSRAKGEGGLANGDENWRRSSSAQGQPPSMDDDVTDEIRRPMRTFTLTNGTNATSNPNPKTNSSLINNKEPKNEERSTNIYLPPHRRVANYTAMSPDWKPKTIRNADADVNNGGGDRNRLGPSSSSRARNRNDESRAPYP